MHTQVAIVGAGPAGLMLAHLLHQAGIESVVLEARSREYVEHRVRAGVLEQGTVDLLIGSGVGERLEREGLRHEGIRLRFEGEDHRIAMSDLTGRAITVYGQQEVVKDLIAARLAYEGPLLFDVDEVTLDGLDTARPTVRFRHEGGERELTCDFVAGCDGSHGVSRGSIPDGVLTTYVRDYPFGWLGDTRGGTAVHRGAGVLPQRARVRAAQHAVASRVATVPPGRSGGGHRGLAG